MDKHISEHELDFSQEGSVERFVCEIDRHKINLKIPQWNIYFITDPKVETISYMVWRLDCNILYSALLV